MTKLYAGQTHHSEVAGVPKKFDLDTELRTAESICIATAFARESGWRIVRDAILDGAAHVRIVTGLYCCHTQPELLEEWQTITGRVKRPHFEARLHLHETDLNQELVFHPKVFIVSRPDRTCFAIVGSGNLTAGGLQTNVECALYTSEVAQVADLREWFEDAYERSTPLSPQIIDDYRLTYEAAKLPNRKIQSMQLVAEKKLRKAAQNSKRVDTLPDSQTLLLPLLQLLADDAEHSSKEIRERIKVQFNIAPQQLIPKSRNGVPVFHHNLALALAYLQGAPHGRTAAIDKVGKESYRITEHGKAIRKRNPSALTIKDL